MTDQSGATQGQPEAARPYTRLTEQRAQLFDELAQRAAEIAGTAEHSAEVHAQLPAHLVNPPDHIARERLLAAAERAAAQAYRAHQVPPNEVRAAIVRAGDIDGTRGAGGPSSSRHEAESSSDA